MVSVSSAESHILSQAKPFGFELCALKDAYGRVLLENIRADRDQPDFNKALMDGIAISFSAWKNGVRKFEIQSIIPAGTAPLTLKNRNHCFQIMTGAVLPKGADCVVPIESVHIDNDIAALREGSQLKQGQFIRTRGADAKKGDTILKKGIKLYPAQIGIIASVGKSKLKVCKRPRIAIISTGDELVDIHKPIKSYQTRLSNAYALENLFQQSGLAQAETFHLPDNKKILYSKIKLLLDQYDILVLSGGVSMGEFDFVPQVLSSLKVKALFHKVVQKPGKPFWFGIDKRRKPVFALPGNPVSTMICAYRYILPYLYHASGIKLKKEHISAKNLPDFKSDLTHFLLVKDGQIIPSGGSGDFISLGRADGFIEYDSNKQQALWPYISWRPQ